MTRPRFLCAVPLRALAVAVALSLACGGAERPRPLHAQRSLEAQRNRVPLPAGLDVAVRVDLASSSSDLGEGPTRQLLLDAIAAGTDPSTASLLERSLSQAAVLWVGVAPPSAAMPSANVLVMRGHFADLSRRDTAPARWSSHATGGEALDLEDPPGGYARVYRLRGGEVLVWATHPQLDRVERTLRGEEDELALRPPERGAVSVAARPAGVLARLSSRYPELAERFRGVQVIEAFAEPTAGVWRADLSLDFATRAQASEVTQVIEKLRRALAERGCAVGALARALAVTSFERDVRVQAVLLGPEIAAVKACVFGEGCCA